MPKGQASKAERRAARKLLGPLRSRKVSAAVKKRYHEAVALFLAWLQSEGKKLPQHEEDLDEEVQDYAETLWEEGEPKKLLADLLSGLKNVHDRLSAYLQGSWRLYTIWSKNEIVAKATPMSRRVLKALAGRALRKNWAEMAFQLLVGFECLLRTAEVCSLTPAAFELSKDGTRGVLLLGETKGQARSGVKETVPLADSMLCCWAQALKDTEEAGHLIGEGGGPGFRKRLKQLLQELGLAGLGYQGYSLRRGGATALFSCTGKYDVCCEVGRWKSVRTARGYIDASLRDIAEMSQPHNSKLDEAEEFLASFLAGPAKSKPKKRRK